MKAVEGDVFKAVLITKGRKTGKPHAVELRAVFYNNMMYFSRRNSQSDWLKNAISNPEVKVEYNGEAFSGVGSLVTDKSLAQKISQLKYTDKRSEESRVVLQVTLCE